MKKIIDMRSCCVRLVRVWETFRCRKSCSPVTIIVISDANSPLVFSIRVSMNIRSFFLFQNWKAFRLRHKSDRFLFTSFIGINIWDIACRELTVLSQLKAKKNKNGKIMNMEKKSDLGRHILHCIGVESDIGSEQCVTRILSFNISFFSCFHLSHSIILYQSLCYRCQRLLVFTEL